MPCAIRTPLGWWLGLFALLAAAGPAFGQAAYTWQYSGTTDWLSTANWAGGPAGKVPGVTAAGLPTDGAATDVARFTQFGQGVSNGVAIDFGAAGGTLSLGALHFDGNTTVGLQLGNSSANTPGVLRLNGATVAGVPNVLIAETSFGYGYYSINPLPNGGTGGPGMTIQLGTPNGVFLTTSSYFLINVPISEAAPGYGFSIQGGLPVILRQPSTFSGPVRVVGSALNINADDRLGLAPAGPTPNRLVLEPAGGFPSVLDTSAATFEIHANRGIAIGPTSGAGDAEIHVPDHEQGNVPVVTYNGVIADNGSGSGRLVKTGGGVLALGGASTFTGGTLIRSGTVRLTNPLGLGSAGTVTVATAGLTQAGFDLPAALLVQSAGTFARPVVVNATFHTSGSPHTGAVTIGTPDFAGAAETLFSGPVTLNRSVTLQAGNTVGTWFTGPISGTGDVMVASPNSLTRTAGFLRTTGAANSFGNLTVGENTTLRLSNAFNNLANRYVPDTSSVTFAPGAVLQLSPEGIDAEAVNALRSATAGAGVVETISGGSNRFALTVGAGNASGAFGGVIRQAAGGGPLALVKAGTGTQTLSNANTYTGGTTVNAGTLLVTNTTGSATGTGPVTVNAGGTLGGTGRVAPGPSTAAVSVVLNGGAVQAGGTAAAPTRTDVLTFTQGLTFDGASTLRSTVGQSGGLGSAGKIDLTAGFISRNTSGAANDELTIRLTNDGSLDLSGNSTYTVAVLSYSGFGIGTGLTPFTGQADPDYFAVAAENFTFASAPLVTLDGGVLSITFTPVPEPGTLLAVAATGLGLTGLVRRHRSSRSSP